MRPGTTPGRYTLRVEAVKIVLLCVVAAIVYGVVHDQVTARICVEYFTEFHPPIFATRSPTLLALGWGVIATWWAGAIIGLLLVISARFGSLPRLGSHDVFPLIWKLAVVMAILALSAGAIGFLWAPVPTELADTLRPELQRRFLADWWAHIASYGSGFIGGLFLCAVVWRRRLHLRTENPNS